jgi:hypothetical protein
LREVITVLRLAAEVVHELAHAPVPAFDDLCKRAGIARTRERDDQWIGRLRELGGRQPALHLPLGRALISGACRRCREP